MPLHAKRHAGLDGQASSIDKQDHFAEQAVRAYAVDQIVYKDEGTGIAIRPSVARNEDEIILRAGYIAGEVQIEPAERRALRVPLGRLLDQVH